MATVNEPADPIAKGMIPTAKQSLGDLFKWKQRVVVTNDFGESHCEWQKPTPLENPFSLMAQLGARDVYPLHYLYCAYSTDTKFSGSSSSAASWRGQLTLSTSMLSVSRRSNLPLITKSPTRTSPRQLRSRCFFALSALPSLASQETSSEENGLWS